MDLEKFIFIIYQPKVHTENFGSGGTDGWWGQWGSDGGDPLFWHKYSGGVEILK